MKIAILEDDPGEAAFEAEVLSSAGHMCHVYKGGYALVHDLHSETFDLLVLDWNVPDMDGTTVLRWVRRNLPGHLPVIFITCHSLGTEIEAVLNAGADDYMIKPVVAGVLKARVDALLRRAYQPLPMTDKAAFGDFLFDTKTKRVERNGKFIGLTQKEYDLAFLLFQHIGQLVSRRKILETLWPQVKDSPLYMMETYMSMLRLKLGLAPENGYQLRPAFRYGYRLEHVTFVQPDHA